MYILVERFGVSKENENNTANITGVRKKCERSIRNITTILPVAKFILSTWIITSHYIALMCECIELFPISHVLFQFSFLPLLLLLCAVVSTAFRYMFRISTIILQYPLLAYEGEDFRSSFKETSLLAHFIEVHSNGFPVQAFIHCNT